ncbi:MAG: hypothetical protein J0L86_14975 [Flavobacteriales bacterium]|nr:hypothetical protein [Flavobacteriales bacterium]
MNITININKATPKVSIIKDEKKELVQINFIIDEIMTKLINDPIQGERVKIVGEEKLREMALQIIKEEIRENEQEQIDYWLDFNEKFCQSMIKGLVDGAVEIAKKL